MIFRYADILLLYAEAVAYGSKNIDDLAFDCMWRVQKRAGVPLISKDVTKAYFQKAVLDERRWETAGMNIAVWGVSLPCKDMRFFIAKKLQRCSRAFFKSQFNIKRRILLFPDTDNELLIVPGLKD